MAGCGGRVGASKAEFHPSRSFIDANSDTTRRKVKRHGHFGLGAQEFLRSKVLFD